MVPALSVHNVTVLYHEIPALWDVSIEIPRGALMAIMGPNGAGKSTFMKSLVGIVKPVTGTIEIFGAPFKVQRHMVAYMPQRQTVDWDFPINVFDVVMMGRYGKLGWLRRPGMIDKRVVYESLEQVDLVDYAYEPISHLSGGQQQRVFFARALAQQAEIYLLDEPFVNIDAITEQALVRILKNLSQEKKTVIIVHHDLHTARTYFDTIFLLKVKNIAYGPVDQIIAPSYLSMAYGNGGALFVP